MSGELLTLSREGRTSWGPLVNLLAARQINLALGGALVGPWDIEQLDVPTIDMITAYLSELPALMRGQAKVEKHFVAWRSQHPTYKRHLRKH